MDDPARSRGDGHGIGLVPSEQEPRTGSYRHLVYHRDVISSVGSSGDDDVPTAGGAGGLLGTPPDPGGGAIVLCRRLKAGIADSATSKATAPRIVAAEPAVAPRRTPRRFPHDLVYEVPITDLVLANVGEHRGVDCRVVVDVWGLACSRMARLIGLGYFLHGDAASDEAERGE